MTALPAQVQESIRSLGIVNPNINDGEVTDKIISTCTKETYSFVATHTIWHCFDNTSEQKKKTRMIELNPTNWQWLVNLVTVLFREVSPRNSNRAVYAILGSINSKDKKELKDAFHRNHKFTIYVAMDLSEFYFEVDDSSTTNKVNRCVIF